METSFYYQHAWLILALPLLTLALTAVVRLIFPKMTGIFGTLGMLATTTFAWSLAYTLLQEGPPTNTTAWNFEWLRYQENLIAGVGVIIDPLSVLLMLVVTTISTLVHFYSIGYMKGDQGFGRYFVFLSLFTFSMLGLVSAPNIIQMFVFWELVGASSFLLIGFYYEKPAAVSASKKAFITTRFADLFFLLGILMLGYLGFQVFDPIAGSSYLPPNTQPFDFLFLNHSLTTAALNDAGLLSVAMVLIFIGAAGKSAMFPLHVWLPDAMEGPTPVSALIHAATMVVAGIYLIARLFPAFSESEFAMNLIVVVGVFTSLFAAVIACTQNDIKRILAFSTLSQLGYMMFALGVATADNGSGVLASLFHLFTHAFFKALLFLGAGAVIHAVHTNNIWEMGGLMRKMPVTHFTFLIATLTISGVPPFAGFISKEAILGAALESGHYWALGIGILVAGLTAFYMGRLYFLTFTGASQTESARLAPARKVHEAPLAMLIPLVVLVVFTLIAGSFPMENFFRYSFLKIPSSQADHFWLAVTSFTSVFIGGTLAFVFYGVSSVGEDLKITGKLYKIVHSRFYVDEIYLFITHQVIIRFFAAPIAWFDRTIVDGTVNLAGWLTRSLGFALSQLQTGQVQTYGAWFVHGAVMLFIFFWVIYG